jgi:hypothetical protein
MERRSPPESLVKGRRVDARAGLQAENSEGIGHGLCVPIGAACQHKEFARTARIGYRRVMRTFLVRSALWVFWVLLFTWVGVARLNYPEAAWGDSMGRTFSDFKGALLLGFR